MKTTNLFFDYILIGAVWVISFLIPIGLVDYQLLLSIFQSDLLSSAASISVVTVAVYVIGVLLDQFANRALDVFEKPFKISAISLGKKAFKKETGVSYYEALQSVVIYSQRAYEYLSYRRSIIRITRSLFTSSVVILPFVVVVSVITYINKGLSKEFTLDVIFLSVLLIVVAFLRVEIVKLHSGYYNALKNFYVVTEKENKKRRLPNDED